MATETKSNVKVIEAVRTMTDKAQLDRAQAYAVAQRDFDLLCAVADRQKALGRRNSKPFNWSPGPSGKTVKVSYFTGAGGGKQLSFWMFTDRMIEFLKQGPEMAAEIEAAIKAGTPLEATVRDEKGVKTGTKAVVLSHKPAGNGKPQVAAPGAAKNNDLPF
jgi:hypothetical protein